jgi:pimeloyl-ACP methyl ester carboxylesterase
MRFLTAPATTWRVNGIDLAVTALGDGPLVVLAHGFPDVGATWHCQAKVLVEAGYRVVIPDMRGYGSSGRPTDVSAYSTRAAGADLIGLLEHEGAAHAHFIGHDWGAACVWQLGLDHPSSVLSLTGLSVPYALPAPVPPTEILRARFGDDFYQLKFQPPGKGERMLERDVAHALAAIYSDRYDLIETDEPIEPPSWLATALFSYYVDQFERTGFSGGLRYYRNIDDNWRRARAATSLTIGHSSLFVTGSADPVTTFMHVGTAAHVFTDLTTVVIDDVGHWVHQQSPARVNDAILAHLRRQPPTQP